MRALPRIRGAPRSVLLSVLFQDSPQRRRFPACCCTKRYRVSVRGGGARGEPGRCRAPAGAAGRWPARVASEVVSPHGLKLQAAPQSLRVPPACVCPPHRGLLRGQRCRYDWPFRGGEFSAVIVAFESPAAVHCPELPAELRTLKRTGPVMPQRVCGSALPIMSPA